MAVNLSHPSNSPSAHETLDMFNAHVTSRVFDSYCSSDQYRTFVEHGMGSTGLERKNIEHAVDLALERSGTVNELRLLEELDSALHRYTASDRKLDAKEKNDALQLVCKSRSGFRLGLRPDVAQAAILAYCRANSVKQKTGIFSWAVP